MGIATGISAQGLGPAARNCPQALNTRRPESPQAHWRGEREPATVSLFDLAAAWEV
jgi:hypothetical protein